MYYVHSLSPEMKFGFASFSYFGLAADFDDDWVSRYYAQELALLTVGVSPSLSYRVSNWLSSGAGPTILFGKLKQKTAINNPKNGGDGEIGQNRGPLAGRLQGEFSKNEIHFLNLTIHKLFH